MLHSMRIIWPQERERRRRIQSDTSQSLDHFASLKIRLLGRFGFVANRPQIRSSNRLRGGRGPSYAQSLEVNVVLNQPGGPGYREVAWPVEIYSAQPLL